MNSLKYDLIVIGASLAGCSAAITAAKAGKKVLCIDKSVFPRSKACGEGLSSLGYAGLQQIFGKSIIDNINPIPHYGFEIISSSRKSIIKSASGLATVFGVQRKVLDYLCAKQTADSCDLKLNQSVLAISKQTSGFRIKTDSSEYFAKVVIAADGARSKIASLTNTEVLKPRYQRYGLSLHLKSKKLEQFPRIRISIKSGFEIYGTWVAEDLINIAVLGDRRLVGLASKEFDFVNLAKEELGIDNIYSRDSSVLSSGPVGTKRIHNSNLPLLFSGDAAESFDPLGGMGMTHAILSGELSAHYAIKILEGRNLQQQIESYKQAREEVAKSLRGFTRLAKFHMRSLHSTRLIPNSLLEKVGTWVESGLEKPNSLPRKILKIAGR